MTHVHVAPWEPMRGQAAVTVDLEDWHRLVHRRFEGRDPGPSGHVRRQTETVLAFLARHEARATFFVLGELAEHEDDLVGDVHDAGHEVATHGHGHVRLDRLSAEEVVADVARSVDVLRSITGRPVLGHRAPEFTITERNVDVLAELARLGIAYDSSIYPIRHRRYGIAGFPARPVTLTWPDGTRIAEFPLATLPVLGARLPVAGGGYYRVLPRPLLRAGVRRGMAAGALPVLYFHPYEFHDGRLALDGNTARSGRRRVWQSVQNLGRERLPRNFEALLEGLHVRTLADVLREHEGVTPSPPLPPPLQD